MTDDASRYAGQFRQALIDGDVMQLWQIWAHVMPHLPQPKTLYEAEIIMHRARTEAESVPLQQRAYSHAWLEERILPSGLPEELKPQADRIYPKVIAAVGISVNMPKLFKEVATEVRASMGDAVENLAADGEDLSDRPRVHKVMFERREQALKSLGLKNHKKK